jgi:hypothetical protein
MRTNLDKANVPLAVKTNFIEMIRTTSQATYTRAHIWNPAVHKAEQSQALLGDLAILRGHHTREWAYAIEATYQPRQRHPCDDRDPPKDKTPLEMSVLLIQQVWNLFDTLWAQRNEILHGPNSHAATIDKTTTFAKLLHFRRNRKKILHPGDWWLIDSHEPGDISKWDNRRRQAMLRNLEECSRAWKTAGEMRSKGQKAVKSYFSVTKEKGWRKQRRKDQERERTQARGE